MYFRKAIYIQAEKKGNGYECRLTKIAPGIITHCVVDNMIISATNFSQDDRLLII